MTNVERITDALAALCRAAGTLPDDASPEAARAVVAALQATGCFRPESDPHSPEDCGVALWIRKRTNLGVLVSGTAHHRGRTGQVGSTPGQVILLGAVSRDGGRDRELVPLPVCVSKALDLMADGEAVAEVRERNRRFRAKHTKKPQGEQPQSGEAA